MKGVNKAIIAGNVGADPEVKHLSEGRIVVNFSIATNRQFKDKSGEKREEVMWHKIEAWGTIAESIAKWVKKGQMIYVEGEIRYNTYEKDGQKRTVTNIMAKEYSLFGGPKDSAPDAESNVQEYKEPAAASSSAPRVSTAAATVTATSADVMSKDDDDLPF